MKIILVLTFYLLISTKTFGEAYWVNKTPLLDTLYNNKRDVSEITNLSYENYLPILLNGHPSHQKLLKDETGLYILIEGTGQVFKAIKQSIHQLYFLRQDSTYFSGYNFGAINFSWHRALYSFGGYGFWKSNGSLRIFQDGREWSVVKLNTEYSSSNTYHCYLPGSSKLYYLRYYFNEISEDPVYPISVIELNLNTRENKILGKPYNLELTINSGFYINIPSLNGLIVASNGDLFLCQFQTNQCFKLKNQVLKNILWGGSFGGTKNTFEMNGKVYFTRENQPKVYSVKILKEDFILTDIPVYLKSSTNNFFLFVSFGVLVFLGIFIFYRKKTWLNFSLNQKSEEVLENSMLEFNEMEKELINLIISQSKDGGGTTVEEINRIIGLTRKSLEVQKKLRSETINKINHKFKVNFNENQEFIQRVRSLEDRRYLKYCIPIEIIDIYNNER